MLIKKVNENKLEIFIGIKDLEENKISINDFMCSSKKRNKYLLNILNFACNKNNFEHRNCKIIIESYSIPSLKLFIITITKLFYNVHKSKYKKLKMNTFFLASFESFDTLCAFCNTIRLRSISSLYFYNNLYFLTIKVTNIFEFKKILYSLKEFAKNYKINFFIDENANLILKNNAIEVCKYLFVE